MMFLRLRLALWTALALLCATWLAWSLLVAPDEDTALISGIGLLISLLLARRRMRDLRVDGRKVILDGSNVMHWNNDTPSLAPIKAVLKELKKSGYSAGVAFDANAGYLLFGEYRDHRRLARALSLTPDRVMIAPKGTPADPLILDAATEMNARVVTNDRFRDWQDSYPAIRSPGFLISGQYRDGKVHLRLPEPQPGKAG